MAKKDVNEDGAKEGRVTQEKPVKPENTEGTPVADGNGKNEQPQDEHGIEYDDDEFNPDKWENASGNRNGTPIMQKGLAIFVSVVAIALFGALFVVEFRSYANARKNTVQVGVTQDDGEEKKKDEADSIMSIIETGTNYTIYLDNETGVEYVMFRVGSTISIQPLINTDGSYKQYVEPTYPATGTDSGEAATKKGLFDGLKSGQKETKTAERETETQTAGVEQTTQHAEGGADITQSQMETVPR